MVVGIQRGDADLSNFDKDFTSMTLRTSSLTDDTEDSGMNIVALLDRSQLFV
jgi:hypothetical protein